MNSGIWFVTSRDHADEPEMHRKLIADLEGLYRKAAMFPNGKFSGIHFAIGYFKGVPERIKLGRVRKSINNWLWVELFVDGEKWEKLNTADLRAHLMHMMTRAVLMVANRYKLAASPFEETIAEAERATGRGRGA